MTPQRKVKKQETRGKRQETKKQETRDKR